jgi:zinc transporter, ZIP family
MWEAAFWGFVGGFALIVGAVVGVTVRTPPKVIGLVMGFGAGVLISAVAFDLTEEAFESAGAVPVVVGLVAGALTFYAGDWLIDHQGGAGRKQSPSGGAEEEEGSAKAIVLGAMLDGVPESVAIGVTLLEGGTVGVAVVTAVFLSNIPESLSAAAGLHRRHSRRWILALWAGVTVLSAAASAAGYGLLGGTPPATVAVVQAFAGGAIITMLADTMMPEAFKEANRSNAVGLVTCVGFILAFLLSHA